MSAKSCAKLHCGAAGQPHLARGKPVAQRPIWVRWLKTIPFEHGAQQHNAAIVPAQAEKAALAAAP